MCPLLTAQMKVPQLTQIVQPARVSRSHSRLSRNTARTPANPPLRKASSRAVNTTDQRMRLPSTYRESTAASCFQKTGSSPQKI